MEPISVLIVDDHPVVRVGLRYMLDLLPNVRVVAEASTGAEALEKILLARPAVVLMDITMPDMDGLEAARRIKEQFPETRVVVMTVHDDEAHVARAVQAGVMGYILKRASPEEVYHAIQSAVCGEITIKAALLHQALGAMRSAPGGKRPERPRSALPCQGEDLTPRERSVLQLLAQGMTNPEIGRELFISAGTAKKHVETILAKLGAKDRTDAAAMAVRLGLVG